jgi:hypothetical protein
MIAAVIPLLLVAAGAVGLLAGLVALRTLGPRYRVGRLLATTPRVTIGEAIELARSGRSGYVRVDGRIDAEDEFEDIHHRPLVFRRTRIEARDRRDWSAYEDSREVVPFEIQEGLDSIAIDADALGDGLVVVPRESAGVAGDLGERAPAGRPADTPVRAVVEQISSIDHAIALGVPALRPPTRPTGRAETTDGPEPPGDPAADRSTLGAAMIPSLTAGLGRPLVLTTLEPQEAMRVLAGGTVRPRIAAACFAVGLGLVVIGLAWAAIDAVLPAVVPIAFAASPEASAPVGGDPRSSGEGPGLVGEPGLAILAVVAIAILALVITTAYVRLTDRREDARTHR